MSSTSIFPKLDKNENEIEKPEVQNFEEEQASVLEQPKVDEVEEDQAYNPSKKHKNDKDDASITSTKKNIYTFDKEEKSKENVVKESNTSSISAKDNTDTVNKTGKSKKSKETIDTSKKNKNDTVYKEY